MKNPFLRCLLALLLCYNLDCYSQCGGVPVVTGPVTVAGLGTLVTHGNPMNYINGKHFYLDSILIIDTNLTIINTIIEMGPSAQIIVTPGTMTGMIFRLTNNTHLFSCGSNAMWVGIKVDNTDTTYTPHIIIDDSSLVEDALTAFYAPPRSAFDLAVDSAFFNRNFIHLFLDSDIVVTPPVAFSVTNSNFTCRTIYDSAASSTTALHVPHSGDRTREGIKLFYVKASTGSHVRFGDNNLVENCERGFDIYKSWFHLYKDTIRNCDYGIKQYFDGFSKITENTFEDIAYAIREYNHVEEIEITDNTFTNHTYGIFLYDYLPDILIARNTLREITVYGILVDNSFVNSSTQLHKIRVYENALINTLTSTAHAMRFNEYGSPDSIIFEVYNNIMVSVDRGIEMNNIISNDTTDILSVFNDSIIDLNYTVGISAINCPRLQCYSNYVAGDTAEHCTDDQNAFYFEDCPELRITCNYETNCENGFVFVGATPTPKFEENVMHNYYYGVLLLNNPKGLGDIGKSGYACMDIWDSTDCESIAHTFAYDSNDPLQSGYTKFYCNPVGEPTLNYSTSLYNPCTVQRVMTERDITCGGEEEGFAERMLSMIASNEYALSNEENISAFIIGSYIFDRLIINQEYRDSFPVLQSIYDSLQNTSIAQLHEIEQVMHDPTSIPQNIISLCNALSTGVNYLDAYSVLYPLIALIDSGGIEALDTVARNALYNLAVLCPQEYGTAVHRARSLYFHIYHTTIVDSGQCIIDTQRSLLPNENRVTADYKVIDDILYIKTNKFNNCLVNIYDATGRLLLSTILEEGGINLKYLQAGIYHFNCSSIFLNGSFFIKGR